MIKYLCNILKSTKEDFDEFQLADLPSETMQHLYNTWQVGRKNGLAIPEYGDLDFNKIACALDNTALIRLIDADGHFNPSYVVLGGSLKKLAGRDLTGKTIKEAFKKNISKEPIAAYARVFNSHRPLFTRRMARSPLKMRGYDRLILPIQDQGAITHAFLFIQPTDQSIKTFEDWREASDIVHWIDYLESN